jgi:hypothetical protein
LGRPGSHGAFTTHGLYWQYSVAAVFIILRLAIQHRRLWATALIGISIATLGVIPFYTGAAWFSTYNGLAEWKRIVDSIQFVAESTPKNQFPIFWIDNNNDPLSAEYRSIMCAFLTHMYSMWKFPEVDPTKKYQPGATVVLITREKNVFDKANDAATRVGMPLRLVKQHAIAGAGYAPDQRVSYWVTLTEVLPAPTGSGSEAQAHPQSPK